MVAPTFVASYAPASNWTSTTTPKTQSVTVAAGDALAVFGGTEGSAYTLATPTGGSLTYTLQQSIVTASYSPAYAWTALPGGSQTFTLSDAMTGGGAWGDIAYRFSGSTGIGNTAKTNSNSGAAALTFSTSQDHSAVACLVLDWNGLSGSSRTWETVNSITPTAGNGYEQAYTLDAGNYTIYSAYWPDAGTAGSVTVGLSAPSGMQYSIIAVEILGTAAALPPVPRPQVMNRAVMRAAVW